MITAGNMVLEAGRQHELDRVDTLTTIQAVAYANMLNSRLGCNDCTDEERKNGLELLERIMDRVGFLKISLEPAFSRIGYS